MEKKDILTGNEEVLSKAFYQMAEKVDKLFAYYERRLVMKEKKKKAKAKDDALVN